MAVWWLRVCWVPPYDFPHAELRRAGNAIFNTSEVPEAVSTPPKSVAIVPWTLIRLFRIGRFSRRSPRQSTDRKAL